MNINRKDRYFSIENEIEEAILILSDTHIDWIACR